MSESTTYVRLVNPAWANHNGLFGMVPFENGRSTRPVTRHEADVLAALTRVETEEGDAVGLAHRLIDGATLPAPVLAPLARQTEAEAAAEKSAAAKEVGTGQPEEAVVKVYTIEELKAVADAKGISGLREIAKPLGVKGRAINELLTEIVREQTERFGKPTQEPTQEPTPADATPPEGEQQPAADADKEESSEPADADKEESSEGEGQSSEGESA